MMTRGWRSSRLHRNNVIPRRQERKIQGAVIKMGSCGESKFWTNSIFTHVTPNF
uniref:Uncharacterized protein n=1 Tax=Physcomitrium patens TaxID=3218 RepID=A0A2K1KQP4_PHYPA|nr:hypothetical protein PHYPA_006986 [Physcomitrium patens]